jgi:hypothetical protein
MHTSRFRGKGRANIIGVRPEGFHVVDRLGGAGNDYPEGFQLRTSGRSG